ncbi:MAG: anti-sigma factor [Flavobacteriaceae bacterium]|nr:anti-sigma factor [Flavobacteriaceae bacterium]
MNIEEIRTSGQLELYVTGSLPAEEVRELEQALAQYPELREDIEQLEATLIQLAEAATPPLPALVWTYILNAIRNVQKLDTQATTRTNWAAITGWAAAILCIAGIFWMLKETNELREDIRYTTTQNVILEEQVQTTETQLANTNELLDILRSKEYAAFTLPGNQAVAPQAYAKVYFNKKDQIAYIDARGLPPAPQDKVYQVWSLIMDPLTPRSVGLLEPSKEIEGGVYRFDNIPDPEAFGITLEPAGGSESPTLQQLYTLGTVAP